MSDNTSLTVVEGDNALLLNQALTKAQTDFLLQRTPQHEIKTRQGRGGLVMSYVEHGYVTERLNLVFGFNWDFEIVDKQILEDEVMVEARLTVRTPAGQTIIKTQFGGADIKRFTSGAKNGRPLSIADDYKAAASDALKKCASLLGIGLDLYGRDRPYEDEQHAPEPAPRPARKQGTERPQPARPSTKTGDRFTEAWKSLKGRGWKTEQIITQVKVVAGASFTEFSALPEDVQIAVVEHLEGIK